MDNKIWILGIKIKYLFIGLYKLYKELSKPLPPLVFAGARLDNIHKPE